MTMKTIIGFTTTAAFCVFLVCASPLKAQNPTAPCALPDDLKQLTHAQFPDGKIATLAELSEDERKDFQNVGDNNCPGVAAVDFYGDGKPTFAITLVWNAERYPTTKLFLAHKPEGSWHLTLLDKADGPVPVVFAWKSGKYESVYRDKKIDAPNPTVMFRGFGSFWIVYAWINHRVDKVWLKD